MFGKGFLQDVRIQMSQNKKLKEVLDQVEEVRDLIQLIAANTAIVKDLHNNVLSYTNKDIQKELESRMYTISQTSFRIQRKLREMGKEITRLDDLTLTSAREGPIHLRIKVIQHTTMIKLFSEIMEDYNISMIRYHEKCRLLLHQQKMLIRKHITSEELEKLLDAQGNNLFVDNILEDSRIARQQLSDIQSRHNDIVKIEKSIGEVRDMFTEMAFLIERQGEQINSVEYFAGRAADDVDTGRIDLKKAEERSQRHRKVSAPLTGMRTVYEQQEDIGTLFTLRENTSITRSALWNAYIWIMEVVLRLCPTIILLLLNSFVVKRFLQLNARKREFQSVSEKFRTANVPETSLLTRNRGYREEQHLTTLMSMMAICFIVTMIPSILLEFVYYDYKSTDGAYLLFRAFAAVTELCNFAIHIIIYFICSREFRKEFFKLLQNRCRKSTVEEDLERPVGEIEDYSRHGTTVRLTPEQTKLNSPASASKLNPMEEDKESEVLNASDIV